MYSVSGPGLSTGPLKQNVEIRNTTPHVLAWRQWSISTLSLGVDSNKTSEGLNKISAFQSLLTHKSLCCAISMKYESFSVKRVNFVNSNKHLSSRI